MWKLVNVAAGIIAIFLIMAKSPAMAQERTAEEAAARGLDLLRQIAQKPTFKQTFQAYGFDSPDQATDLKLLRPLEIRFVRLDRLQRFQPDTEADQLLEPTVQVIYPVMVGEKITTSITVSLSRRRGVWRATRFGAANLIRRLTQFPQYRESHTSFLVHIPDLNLYFLGDRINGQLKLTPVINRNRPDSHLEAGQTLSAQEALARLVPEARARGKGPG